jgi:UDP-perosamine 4-acetyltransferase
MPQVVIVGAGGHAKVIIDILEQRDELRIAGCTSAARETEDVLGYPVLGTDDCLPALFSSGVRSAIVAIGDNRVRMDRLCHLRDAGFELVSAISPDAIVSPRAMLGRGVSVMPGAVINVAAGLEDGVIANTGSTIDHDCAIGQCAHIAPGANLGGGVRVGAGSLIGIGSRVIPGVTIGPWATVAAGAVVIRDLDANVTAMGVPARVTRIGTERGR